MKILKRVLKNFVSHEDHFIHRFDYEHADQQSASQAREVSKHQRIAKLRDQIVDKKVVDQFWDSF